MARSLALVCLPLMVAAACLMLAVNAASKCQLKPLKHKLLLDCSHRNLSVIPADMPINITELDLSHNKLTDLVGLEGLPKLKKLDLTNNKLNTWNSSWLSNCPKLMELHLTQNKLKQPPDVCSSVPNLTGLWLNANPIQDGFGNEYRKCKSLIKLLLAETEYVELTDQTLAGLAGSKLASLQISSTKLKTVHSNCLVTVAGTLKTLDLGQNKALDETVLKRVLDATQFKSLQNLLLSGSEVSITDSTFANCSAAKTIQTLQLDSTPLSELTAHSLMPLQNLASLSLRHTKITGWPTNTFSSHKSLYKLDLRNTLLTTIGGKDGSVNPLPQLNGNLKTLQLVGANISCDCNLMWFIERLQEPTVRSKVNNINKTLCAQPQAWKGTEILKFRPEGCGNTTVAPNPAGKQISWLLFILIASAAFAGAVFIVSLSVIIVIRCRRPEGPRLVLDDDCDPLVTPGQRRSIWIRLRRLLRPSRASAPRPPIFVDPAPEDFLSEDA